MFSVSPFPGPLALAQGKGWKRTDAAKGPTASSSAGADLCQVQPARETGRKSPVPLSAREVQFLFPLLPSAYVRAAAPAVTV